MNKSDIKYFLIDHCPNIPALRKYLTKKKIESLKRRLIPETEVMAGEADWSAKEEIVNKYTQLRPKYMAEGDERITKLLHDAPCYQGRIDLDKVRVDAHFCRLAYGFAPEEYVFFDIEGKTVQEKKSFVSSLERIIAAFSMNDFSDMQILNDKWKTYNLLKSYFKRDAVLISKSGDFNKFREFIQEHPVFIKKQLNLNCGQGVELVDVKSCGMTERELFEKLISYGKVILEEKIIQSEETAVFNESSVNTVRFFTFNTRNGIKKMGFFRTGRAGAFVDNGGAGGIFSAINMEAGIIMTDGCDELGTHYEVHPTSGVRYSGFQLPEWDKAVALCTATAALFPTIKYIGWDLAHTDNGWVLVEANMAGQMIHQGALRRGIKDELNTIMKDMDLMV